MTDSDIRFFCMKMLSFTEIVCKKCHDSYENNVYVIYEFLRIVCIIRISLKVMVEKMVLLLGGLSFLLMIFYDVNQIKFHLSIGKWAFALGSLLLSIVSIYLIFYHREGLFHAGIWQWIFLGISFLFLVLLVYTLFFALPFDSTYVKQSDQMVYDQGVYALSRHPGILWFFLFYLFLTLALSSMEVGAACVVFSSLNLAYAYIQDVYIFPKQLSGYESYQKRVPFIIPTSQSIKACFKNKR